LNLLDRFINEIGKPKLTGKALRVALSGGSDSMALCELLNRAKGRFDLAALHVIHGIREEGETDAEFVRDYCRIKKIPLDVRRIDVPKYADEHKIGIEEAARELRYNIFSEYISRGEIIVTGHTADDVVETLLFNLIRGTGPRGLAGIPEERDGIIRPLLSFWRNELEDWLKTENIAWREDESNRDLRFTRNRIRWMLIPEIKRVFGESAKGTLRREADIFTACSEFIDNRAALLFEKALLFRLESILCFDTAIAAQTLWGFGEVLKRGISGLGEGLSDLAFDTVERLYYNISNARKGRRFPIISGLHLEVDGDFFFLFKDIKSPEKLKVEINSEIVLPGGSGSIKITRQGEGISIPYDGGPLTLKKPSPGDRIDPEHKLRRTLARKGVPRILRDILPILYSSEKPIYSPIIGGLKSEPGLFNIYIEYKGPLENISNRIKKGEHGKLQG